MATTYPNQKWIQIHKNYNTNNFLMVDNNEWMTANKTLSPYGLQLYLFLAANRDGYQFALSPEYAHDAVGISRTTFYEYLRRLETSGYLVWRCGNVFDFYTSPRPANERTHPDHHKNAIDFESGNPSTESVVINASAQQTENPACEQGGSPCSPICSPSNIETNNKWEDTPTDNRTNNAGKPRTPASPDADASVSPSKERIVHIKVPQPPVKPAKPRPWAFMDDDEFVF